MSGTQDIEADIARTRAELKATVDQLSERLNPKAQASEAVDDVKIAVADLKRRVTGTCDLSVSRSRRRRGGSCSA